MTLLKVLVPFLVLFLSSCATMPRVLPPVLDGTWWYAGGEPSDDRELHFSTWPETKLEIEAARGDWRSYRDPSHSGHDALFLAARVVAVNGNVVTLKPAGRAFQIYWRLVEGRLEFWYGSHPDWLKPHLIYVRR